ncbi:hypothetical protein [Neobacillus sp. DY30]|nr:hypothetical protein [Neobacillus sp. DY30]WHY00379.1 hypothetical protein QNH29_28300 [Neobacillus sp. DY30]
MVSCFFYSNAVFVGLDETDTYIDTKCEEIDDTFPHSYTIRGQKEKE